MTDRVKYWLEMADDDLITARALLKTRRYLWAGFLCHLIIEKGLKAAVSNLDTTPPKIHDLTKLAKLATVYDKMSGEQKEFLEDLLPLCIEARYKSYKDALAKEFKQARCESFLKKTKELLAWIKQQF